MIGQCAAPRGDLGLVKGLLETVDCNIREGVQGGYAALFGPTSPLTAVITVLLTIYVALLGLRLLTGRTDMRVGDLPMIGLKIGAVVLLTTSWTTYQGLVFAALFDGPAQVADQLLVNLPSTTAGPVDLFARLQATFDQLTAAAAQLAVTADAGSPEDAASRIVVEAGPGAVAQGINPIIQMRSALQGGPAFGATALWISAVTMLISTMGLLILAKLMLGLLLAIGPLFVGMLLFESTKGFFEGWLRTALGFALMPLATIIFTAALLASIEPSIARLALAEEEARYDLEPVLTVLVITITFTVVFATVMGMCMRLVAGFRLPAREQIAWRDSPAAGATGSGPGTMMLPAPAVPSDVAPSRAARLAATLAGTAGTGGPANDDRRAAQIAAAVSGPGAPAVNGSMASDRRSDLGAGRDGAGSGETQRLGQSWSATRQRRTLPSRGGAAGPGVANAQTRLTPVRGSS